jgi:hypothetical protein
MERQKSKNTVKSNLIEMEKISESQQNLEEQEVQDD